MAQLRLQRAKAKAKAKAEAKARTEAEKQEAKKAEQAEQAEVAGSSSTRRTFAAEYSYRDQQHDQQHDQPVQHCGQSVEAERKPRPKPKLKAMGNYRYDPIRGAYFPVSSMRRYDPHGVRDFGTGSKDGEKGVAVKTDNRRMNGNSDSSNRMVVDSNISKAAVRMSTCPILANVIMGPTTKTKRRRNAMGPMVHVYQAAYEVTASARRRRDLRSEMASALLASGNVGLVPSVRRVVVGGGGAGSTSGSATSNTTGGVGVAGGTRSSEAAAMGRRPGPGTDDRGMSNAHASCLSRYRWVSLLKPLPRHVESRRGTPLDCGCKEELHPSARTFDVMDMICTAIGDTYQVNDTTPHIVTITGGRDKSSLCYRGAQSMSESPYSLSANDNEVLNPSNDWVYNSVRFAPFMSADGALPTAIFGALSSSSSSSGRSQENFSRFTLHRGGPHDADTATPFVSADLKLSEGQSYDDDIGPALMNDFVFNPGSSSSAPGIVAFAPGKCFGKQQYRPSFLDFERMRFITQPRVLEASAIGNG